MKPTREFLALQKKWYAKLRDKGFRDIEVMDRDGSMDSPMLLDTASSIAANFDESREEYYRLARAFVFEADFQSAIARHIWTLHADGVTYRAIVKSLPKNGFHPYELFYVQGIVRRIRDEMYLKMGVTKKTDKQLELFNAEETA